MVEVLDSSAMIAWLSAEPEGALVEGLFVQAEEGEGIEIYAHSVNLAEVFVHVLSLEGEQKAQEAITLLIETGVVEQSDMDGDFWRDMARLIAQVRSLPKAPGARGNLALGDAFGVALANRLGGDFVTKDRTEIEPIHDAGLVSALFIR